MTRNLARRRGAQAWVLQAVAARSPAVLFLQELPATPLRVEGYSTFSGPDAPSVETGLRPCRSALLIREDVATTASPVRGGPLAALGTYGAAVTLMGPAGPTVLASIHASPTRVPAQECHRLASEAGLDVGTRSCEAGPWWADVTAAALTAMSDQAFVAAGDYNEAIRWDGDHPGHSCGAEFFAQLTDRGIEDAATQAWGAELATRRNPNYQLDRVLVSTRARPRVTVDAQLPVHDDASDHAPIWFTLAV